MPVLAPVTITAGCRSAPASAANVVGAIANMGSSSATLHNLMIVFMNFPLSSISESVSDTNSLQENKSGTFFY